MKPFFRDLPIGAKVAMAPAIVVFCLVVIAVVAHLSNQAAGNALGELSRRSLPDVTAATQLQVRATQLDGMVMRSLAYEGAGMKAKRIEALDKQIADEMKSLLAHVGQLKSQARGADVENYERAEAALKVFIKYSADTLEMKSGGLAQAAMMMTSSEAEYAKLGKALEALVAGVSQRSNEQATAAAHTMTNAGRVTLGMMLAAVALSAFVTWLAVRLITRPLGEAVRIAKEVASGNLQRHVNEPGRDATGQVLGALDEVTSRLSAMMGDIRSAADQIDHASREIATGNQDLSLRTEQTASALQQTASTVEELAAQMKQNSETATRANHLASEAASVAREGGGVVQDVVTTMAQINTQAQRIREIIGVIDSIAFQTNILSLNAAVEAARAGEQGRGFAVVAQEVRALASRSSDAAKEIRSLIGASVEQANAGSERVQAAGKIMTRIVSSIEEVSLMVAEMARANNEQAEGVAGVNQAVGEMDRNTQQNAALVEEAAAATESLKAQAQGLMSSLAVFRTA
jgi:methyl-accepting chemotaxis protein